MKKTYLLIILCCIFNGNIFSSEKSINEQQDRETRKFIDHWNHISYETKEAVEKAKVQAYSESAIKIAQLKKEHQEEIALYERKITTMQCQLEEKDRQINNLISNK